MDTSVNNNLPFNLIVNQSLLVYIAPLNQKAEVYAMSNTLRHLSLKSKIIITSTVAVLAMSCALTLFSTHVLEKEIDTTISERINEVSVAATEGSAIGWMQNML